MAAPHQADVLDAVTINAPLPHPPSNDASHTDAEARHDQRWWQSNGVTLSGEEEGDIVGAPRNIANLGNDAFTHNERSSSTSSASSASVSGDADTIYSEDCAADPGIFDDIRQMLLEVWNITEPKTWQLKSIYLMAHASARDRRCLLLTRGTGDGKSLVIYGLATLLRGITIVIVPILALGIDQVSTF